MFSTIQGKPKDSHICLLDFSCTKHMTFHKEWFHNLEPLPSLENIYLGDGKSQQTKGMTTHPQTSLMDSTANPKVKTIDGRGVGARSLARSILGVEGRVRVLG
jgi:hypothetical protein